MYPRPTTGAINRKTTKSSETVDASSLSSRTNKKEKPYELSYIRYPPRPFLPIELTQAIATFFHPLQRACCALTVSKSLELGNPFMSSRAALFHAFELQLPAPIQLFRSYVLRGINLVKYKESQPPADVSASKKLKDHTIISNNIKMQLNEQPIRMKQPSESLDLGVSLLIQDLGRLITDPIIYNNDEVRIELGKVIQQRFECSYLGDIARPDTWGYAESIRAGSKTHWTCTSCTIPKPDKRSLSLWLTLNNFEKHRYKKHLNDGIESIGIQQGQQNSLPRKFNDFKARLLFDQAQAAAPGQAAPQAHIGTPMNDPLPVLPIDQQASSSHQQYQQGGLLQQQSFPSGGYPLFEFESTFDDIGHPKPSKVRRVTFDTGTGGKSDGTAEALPINPSSSTATNFQLFPAAESLLSTYASGKEKQEDWDDDDDESEVTDEEYFYGDTGEMDEEEMSDDNPSPQADE